MSVCELSKDYPRSRDTVVVVRGVYYYGLRQECPQKCTDGLWPSFINLEGGDNAVWEDLAKAGREVEAEAKRTGKRVRALGDRRRSPTNESQRFTARAV